MSVSEVQRPSSQALYVGAFVPAELKTRLERRARENDRSASAELRRALVRYLADERGGG